MDLYGIGFSNIRMPDSNNDYTYKYDLRINIFPEEVYIHEFLHTLERLMGEYDKEVIALHAYKTYGYNEEKLIGLKNWYQDYMNSAIKDTHFNSSVGLSEFVYKAKPAHKSNFDFPVELAFNNEPKNILQDAKSILDVVASIFKKKDLDLEKNIRDGISN